MRPPPPGHVHHGGDALGNSLAGDDHHVFLRQSLALLSGHNDVAVVGQNKHGLSGDLIDPGQNTSPWRGSWSDRRKPRRRSPDPGTRRQAVAGADGQEAYGLFRGRLLLDRFLRFQFFLNGVQIIGALGGLARPARRPERMFSIFASSSVPYFWDSVRAAPGMSVWTWTLKVSSSSPMTRLSPMLLR